MLRRATLALLLVACNPPAAAPDAGADTGMMEADASVAPPDDSPWKGPFVMRPATDAVVVRWESRLMPAQVAVDYRPEAGGPDETATGTSLETLVMLEYTPAFATEPDVPGTYYVNEVELTGLTPATCYTYEIAGYPDAHGRFCTMHEPTDHTTPITFYAIGDTSPGVMQTLRLIAHTDPAMTEFSVHVGDIQYYSTLVESQQLWFSLMEPMLRANAFLPCVGNHEDERPHEFDDIYERLFGHAGRDGVTRWYHYESGGVHFISLSTEDDIALGSEQNDWFRATMDRIETEPGYRFTVVYFHRPIYSLASYAPNLDNRAAIEAVITTHNVPLVLAGHMHAYERFQIDDITHVTTGSGGFLDAEGTLDDNEMAFPADVPRRLVVGHYFEVMVIEVVPDTGVPGGSVIQARAIDEMGTMQDSFEIHVPPWT
jgi:hypothetical protein